MNERDLPKPTRRKPSGRPRTVVVYRASYQLGRPAPMHTWHATHKAAREAIESCPYGALVTAVEIDLTKGGILATLNQAEATTFQRSHTNA